MRQAITRAASSSPGPEQPSRHSEAQGSHAGAPGRPRTTASDLLARARSPTMPGGKGAWDQSLDLGQSVPLL